jgi:hypothetical protein
LDIVMKDGAALMVERMVGKMYTRKKGFTGYFAGKAETLPGGASG